MLETLAGPLEFSAVLVHADELCSEHAGLRLYASRKTKLSHSLSLSLSLSHSLSLSLSQISPEFHYIQTSSAPNMRALGCKPMSERNPPVIQSEWSLMSPPRYSVYSVYLFYKYKSTSASPSMRVLGSILREETKRMVVRVSPHVLSLLAFANTTVQILAPEGRDEANGRPCLPLRTQFTCFC